MAPWKEARANPSCSGPRPWPSCAPARATDRTVGIYRRLIEGKPDDERRPRWVERCGRSSGQSKAGGLASPPLRCPRRPGGPGHPRGAGPAAGPVAVVEEDITDVTPIAPWNRMCCPRRRRTSCPGGDPAVRSGQVVLRQDTRPHRPRPVNPAGRWWPTATSTSTRPCAGGRWPGLRARGRAHLCQKLEAELLAINGIYLVWEYLPRSCWARRRRCSCTTAGDGSAAVGSRRA